MTGHFVAPLIQALGFLTGAALHAMLLAMVLRSARGRVERVALRTAVVGLAWNIAALSVLELGERTGAAGAWVVALAYAAFGLLPALFVDASLPAAAPGGRALRLLGYGLSAVAGLVHVRQVLAGGEIPSVVALQVVAGGFLVLAPALALSARPPGRAAAVAVRVTALLAFALSALHLAQHRAGTDTWSAAAAHHASIPLVLATLYLDYRFALADLFLKRALTLLMLVAVALGLYATTAAPLLEWRAADGALDGRAAGALLALWVLTAIAYPALRSLSDRFVDVVVLRRPDYVALRRELEQEILRADGDDDVLDILCRRLGSALSAPQVTWRATVSPDSDGAVPITTADMPAYALSVGPLAAGRRLLSDELHLLSWATLLAARRIDALRLTRERLDRKLRDQEMAQLAAQAELRALRSQLNPHFLFNALNTVSWLVRSSPERAHAVLMDLTRLLRAVLSRTRGEFTTLRAELDLVESYLAIEQARFEERLTVRVEVPAEMNTLVVPALSLQPLVENAVKHGVGRQRRGGQVVVRGWIDATGAGPLAVLEVEDSGAGFAAARGKDRRRGIGLGALERRLELHYGGRGSLQLASTPGTGTRVTLRLPAQHAAGAETSADEMPSESAP